MDFQLKIKALTRLANSKTEDAEKALSSEFDKYSKALERSLEYEELEQAIEVIQLIGFRFAKHATANLIAFIDSIGQRDLSLTKGGQTYGPEFRKYFNADSLVVKAIDALVYFRNFEPKSILGQLIKLANIESKEISQKALSGLKSLASYDVHVYYGVGSHTGIGPWPQIQIAEELASYTDQMLGDALPAIAEVVNRLLSLEANGVSWSFNAATFSKALIQANGQIAEIRRKCIDLLIRMYALSASITSKTHVLNSLNSATRVYGIDQGSESTVEMVANNTLTVLRFFRALIDQAPLQIVQKIEHDTYWIHFHSTRLDVRAAAREIEVALNDSPEYQRYKILVGFEGIFSDWTAPEVENQFEKIDEFRRESAIKFAAEISDENFDEWKERLIRYASTESNDLATFPTFYFFLEQFSARRPDLALKLLRSDHHRLSDFLIPLLRGIWGSDKREEVRELCQTWVEAGLYLPQCSRLFLQATTLDLEFLQRIMIRAIELTRADVLSSLVSVAASNYKLTNAYVVQDLFIPAIKALSEMKKADWVYDFWFRKEAKEILPALSNEDVDVVLQNLLLVDSIDYHSEEVLYLIAKNRPQKVFESLCLRLARVAEGGKYEAVPFLLHKLNEPLSKIPQWIVRSLRKNYDGDYWKFVYGGARLLKIIFADFSRDFSNELQLIIRSGSEKDFEFVLAVLRNYDGSIAIQETCLELVKQLPIDSQLLSEVASVLEATGVVQGEFGFAEAFEKKKEQLSTWLSDPNEKVQRFAKMMTTNLESMSTSHRKQAEEEITLRKAKYGDSDS